MALQLISDTTNIVRTAKKRTKSRRPVSGGVIIHFETWKRQRPTKGTAAAEPKTLVVNAQTGWVESVVGAFDDNPIYEGIMANAKVFRESLDRQLTSE